MRIVAILTLFAARAWCCSCFSSPTGNPPCQKAWQSDAVFTGTVESMDDPGFPTVSPGGPIPQPPFPQKKVRMTVLEALNGLEPGVREITVETGLGGGDCGYNFQRGRKYIVYASKRSGVLSTGICSPTRPLEDADDDLAYFHSLANATPTAEVRVTAFNGWRITPAGRPEMETLAGAAVTIDGPGVHQTAVTDASGRHVFPNLPPGEYKISGALGGYTTAYPLKPVAAHAMGCVEFGLPLQLDRTVSGRVTDRDGQPVAGILIEAVPARPRHENELPFAVDSAATNADGRYELRHLTTGDYYLGVSLSRSPVLEQPYTRWFYPGTEDPQRADLVHLIDKPGAQRFDLILPPAQHDRVIRGTVVWPDGRPAPNTRVFVEDPRWAWQTGSMVNAQSDREGRFTIHVLDGTSYRLHATSPGREPVSALPVPVAPGDNALDLQFVLTQKGHSIQNQRGLEDWRKGLGIR